MKRPIKIFVLLIFIFLLGTFIYKVLAAGRARHARFNVDVVAHVLQAYYKQFAKFPMSIKELPDFQVVSALDRLSCNAKQIRGGVFRGYVYHLESTPKSFVLTASPAGWLSGSQEFGITEANVLKTNFSSDPEKDSREEIKDWNSVGRLSRIQIQ